MWQHIRYTTLSNGLRIHFNNGHEAHAPGKLPGLHVLFLRLNLDVSLVDWVVTIERGELGESGVVCV